MPVAPVIMVIRHAEKPTATASGVNEDGKKSSRDLIVRGWERAGALVCLFAPTHGPLQSPLLAKPAFLFASASSDGSNDVEGNGNSKSRRSEETLKPLAEKLGIEINRRFTKGQEPALAQAAQACDGPVLIAWQHEKIYEIAKAIPGGSAAPTNWPENRFDVIFVFTLNASQTGYEFTQVPECLLAGDLSTEI